MLWRTIKKNKLLYVVVVDADSDVVADFDIFFIIMLQCCSQDTKLVYSV